jgi:hypothetical protein
MNKSISILALAFFFGLAACKIYSFKDTSIPPEVKTIHLAYIENRARLVNPALAPALNDALRQKINNQASRLSQIQTSDADYDVTAWVSDYNYSTSGISGQPTSKPMFHATSILTPKPPLPMPNSSCCQPSAAT